MAGKETPAQQRDRLYNEARREKASRSNDIPNQVGKNIPNQVGANIPNQVDLTRDPSEYYSGKAFDAKTKKALKDAGAD